MAERVLVMGLGRSGRSAAAVARADGAEVTGVDLNLGVAEIPGVRLELGPHRRETFLSADRIVVSPGIPANQPDLAAAHQAGVPIVGELAFAAEHLDLPMVAVTGTNGKSTVTWFTGQLLQAAGRRPFVGGNLGNPLSDAVLAGPDQYDVAVVEVSSYQLEWRAGFDPRVGVILNLTPDHLARHGTLDGYAAAKCRLFDRMGPGDLAILPVGDPVLARHAGDRGDRAWLGAHPGVIRRGDTASIAVPTRGIAAEIDLSGLPVPGAHNRDNAATAALLAIAMGAAPAAVARAIPGLKALAHRMEIVAVVDGVTWINDSKATNVDAARVGLAGLDRPVVALLGGEAKGDGFGALAPALATARAVICFGGSGPAIADELVGAGVPVVRAGGLADAVARAADLARDGDAVLLSPGCASFDEFNDFEHRGRVFRDLVHGRAR